MTVKELIEYLQTLPQDHLVIYKMCSDYSVLEPQDIEVVGKETRKVVKHHNMPGRVRQWRDYENKDGAITPEFIDTVIFPGN